MIITIEKIIVEDMENEGCTNGNYPFFSLIYSTKAGKGKRYYTISGQTCRCQNGCSGTQRIADLSAGNVMTLKELQDYMES